MTAKELIEAIAQSTGYPKAQIKAVLEAEAEALGRELTEGRDAMSVLGIFKVVQLQAKNGRNPKTGAPMEIPARRAIKFKPRKELGERITLGMSSGE